MSLDMGGGQSGFFAYGGFKQGYTECFEHGDRQNGDDDDDEEEEEEDDDGDGGGADGQCVCPCLPLSASMRPACVRPCPHTPSSADAPTPHHLLQARQRGRARLGRDRGVGGGG